MVEVGDELFRVHLVAGPVAEHMEVVEEQHLAAVVADNHHHRLHFDPNRMVALCPEEEEPPKMEVAYSMYLVVEVKAMASVQCPVAVVEVVNFQELGDFLFRHLVVVAGLAASMASLVVVVAEPEEEVETLGEVASLVVGASNRLPSMMVDLLVVAGLVVLSSAVVEQ